MPIFLNWLQLIVILLLCGCANVGKEASGPLLLQAQGSFAAGGSTIRHRGTFRMTEFHKPDGQTAYGDHLYAFYQVPVHARTYPLVFQHGGMQSKRTWESTPDGREGFQTIFLRRGFATYLVDQPRRGEAAATTVGVTVTPSFTDRRFYSLFRLGEYPGRYAGVQFPAGSEALEQFMRQIVPNTGPLDFDVAADAMGKLLDKIGPAILVTHSQGGTIGWRTPLRTGNVKAIVAYEPGGSPFLFPESELPEPVETAYGQLRPLGVPMTDFLKLTCMPIIIYYGDNIATNPVSDAGRDQWRGELWLAKRFAAAVNRHGGDASVVHLPEIGIVGNTHFPFADLNNREIADLLSAWLHEKRLDRRE